MSTKAPTSSSKAEPVAHAYEEFKPHYEWQERLQRRLLIRLPAGFKSEDLRVRTSKNMVMTVEGQQSQHPVGKNKLKRFKEEFPIPEDCVVEEITAKLGNGILAITMPVLIKKQDQGEKEIAPKTHVPPHKEETRDVSPPKTTSGEDRKNPIPQDPPIHPAHETGNNKHGNKAEKAESQIASYRQVIKRLTESNEDKQLLVNAVVAVLVIVALGAYMFRKQVTA